MVKAIPKKLLIHQATYKKYLGDTGEGVSFGTSVDLVNVRIEKRKQSFRAINGNEIIGNALMFYDLENSGGFAEEPVVNSTITFNGHTYHIIDVETLFSDKPHHYEVLLK
jgi:hypothetical protein